MKHEPASARPRSADEDVTVRAAPPLPRDGRSVLLACILDAVGVLHPLFHRRDRRSAALRPAVEDAADARLSRTDALAHSRSGRGADDDGAAGRRRRHVRLWARGPRLRLDRQGAAEPAAHRAAAERAAPADRPGAEFHAQGRADGRAGRRRRQGRSRPGARRDAGIEPRRLSLFRHAQPPHRDRHHRAAAVLPAGRRAMSSCASSSRSCRPSATRSRRSRCRRRSSTISRPISSPSPS